MPRPAASYSAPTILLHWIVALLVLANFVAALGMWNLAGSPRVADRELAAAILRFHQSSGLLLLLFGLLLLLSRWRSGRPPQPPRTISRQRTLARCIHCGLYALLLLLPLAGWAMVSANPGGQAMLIYGRLDWPLLPLPRSRDLRELAAAAHLALAVALAGLLLLHLAGLLKRQLLDGDPVLLRMLPWLKKAGS